MRMSPAKVILSSSSAVSVIMLASITSPMRPAATLAWGYITRAKAAITIPFITRATYCTMAKISPPEAAEIPLCIRLPPKYRIATATRFIKAMAMGATRPIFVFASMICSAITQVASAMRPCSCSSLLKARMTRMPCSRSRTRSFCLSQNWSLIFHSGSTLRPIASTSSVMMGIATRIMSASVLSLEKASTTPPKNSTGMVMMLLESISATQASVPTSWVERVSSAEVPMRLTSSKVRAFTRPKTAARRSAQKPETTWVRHQVPAATAPSESSVTSSILPQQRRI